MNAMSISAEEFAEMPRIIGTEMEYSVHDTHEPIDDLPQSFYEKLPFDLKQAKYFLTNGARFYRDYHQIPEYATPECAGAREAVVAELAGERIVQAAVTKLQKGYHVFKHVSDGKRATRGYHENYLMRRLENRHELDEALYAHLTSRLVFSGAGTVRHHDFTGKPEYTVAEKAWDITNLAENTTTSNKPLVNLRDEPLSDGINWQRIHITSGDAHMAEWALWYTLASTSALLRLLEAGVELGGLAPTRPLLALHRFAGDVGLKKTVEVLDGRKLSALDIQEQIIGLVRDNLLEETDDKELQEFATEGQKACDDARKDPELLSDRVDWIAKRQIVAQWLEKRGLTLESSEGFAEAKKIDLHYSDLNPKTGAAVKLRERGLLKSMVTHGQIAERTTEPPQSTRAAWRGQEISSMTNSQRNTANVNWDIVGNSTTGKREIRTNPYAAA